MTSFKKVTWAPFALSAGIDLLAVALIASGQRYLQSYLGAIAIHLVAVFVVVKFDDRLLGSRRGLAAALTLALPLAGAGLAAIALCTRPQAGLVAAIAVDYVEPPMLDAACFQKIATALSPCEVLSAPANEASSATLAALTRRGDGESVKLLRWLVIANPEMAVDAALALEELSMRFDAGLELRRRDLALAPSAESAFATAAFISHAMQSGLIDPVMLNSRASRGAAVFSRWRGSSIRAAATASRSSGAAWSWPRCAPRRPCRWSKSGSLRPSPAAGTPGAGRARG